MYKFIIITIFDDIFLKNVSILRQKEKINKLKKIFE